VCFDSYQKNVLYSFDIFMSMTFARAFSQKNKSIGTCHMSSGLPVITKVNSVEQFRDILANNPGIILLKFGATWCGPCKQIDADVKHVFSKMPATVQCMMLDIDESIEIYSFLKNKRMINGVPVLLCYKKGNMHYVPNDIVVGANKDQIAGFFERSFALLQK